MNCFPLEAVVCDHVWYINIHKAVTTDFLSVFTAYIQVWQLLGNIRIDLGLIFADWQNQNLFVLVVTVAVVVIVFFQCIPTASYYF